jgi:sporulation protein YlmC with PRC-barrel domain
MLQLSASLVPCPVLSLRAGGPIADTTGAIINPNNLKVEGFHCHTTDRQDLVLLYQDIRDVIPQGMVVNDADVLAEPDELIRLRETLELNFELIGKPVFTPDGNKVGKVADFATEVTTMYVQKLYVTRSLLKSLASSNLGIDRTQIIEITPEKIIINDLHGTVPAQASAVA